MNEEFKKVVDDIRKERNFEMQQEVNSVEFKRDTIYKRFCIWCHCNDKDKTKYMLFREFLKECKYKWYLEEAVQPYDFDYILKLCLEKYFDMKFKNINGELYMLDSQNNKIKSNLRLPFKITKEA